MIISWVVVLQRRKLCVGTSLSLEAGGCKHNACKTKAGVTCSGSQACLLGAAQSTVSSSVTLT
jgi:hypothetical protein